MCKIHEEEHQHRKTVECSLCYSNHEIPETGFIPNKSFEILLEKNVEYVYLRKEHRAALSKFEQFADFYEHFKTLRNYPELDIHKTIGDLRLRMESRRDELKNKIDRHAAEFAARLDEYEAECKARLDRIDMHAIDERLRSWENDLRVWRLQLASFQKDVHKWKNICDESSVKFDEMKAQFEKFKDELYLNLLDEYKTKNLLFDTDFDMIKNHLIMLEVNNLSQYNGTPEVAHIESEPVRALGVDWKIRVNISNCTHRFIDIYLLAIQNPRIDNVLVDFDLAIVNLNDPSKNLIKSFSKEFQDNQGFGWQQAIELNDLMRNNQFYDASNDCLMVQATIKRIQWEN